MSAQRKVYFNSRFVSEAEARMSIFDTGVKVGSIVYEVTRTFNGKPFRLRDHLERMYTGLKLLEMNCGLTMEQMDAATQETIEANRACFPDGVDYEINHDVSSGPPKGVFAEAVDGAGRPTVFIHLCPLRTVAHLYDAGVHAVVPPQHSIPARLLDPKAKVRGRVHFMVAGLQARKIDPKAWPLLTDEDGFITESTGANFFLVKDGALFTPEPRNILRGITRMAVMEMAGQMGLPCYERNLEPYDVVVADEAFLTTTPFCIVPMTRFDGHPVGSGVPGPVTKRVIAAWDEMVGVDTIAQAKDYAKRAKG
ncbi:MAG: branched-chain amino acid aminotransferase [Planctomycetes bacterium]|nr:branched-chain amino acid aminotransferase [Planctomycetota bacterium]